MKIIDLQRRLREVGRIRIGEQVPAANGKTRPKKLQSFRLTSRDRLVIEAAAEQWGGTATKWEGAPTDDQWQVFTETASLPVIVPPGDMSFSQAYEVWSAGGCKVRCDGRWDHIADTACHCDPENRACDIHTRLSVILPDLPGIGVWRLDTQGFYAAVELGGIVDLVASHTERGVMLPARLRLEQRTVKRVDNGKVVTRNFAVPVLDVDVHPLSLVAGAGAVGELEVARPALPAGSITPVPSVDGVAAPTIAEQMAGIDDPQPRAARANAAKPIPPTGVRPRTARDAEGSAPATDPPPMHCSRCGKHYSDGPVEPGGAGESQYVHKTCEVPSAATDGDGHGPEKAPDVVEPVEAGEGGSAVPSSPAPGERGVTKRDIGASANKAFAELGAAAPRGQKTKTIDRLRYALAYAVTGGQRWHLDDLSPLEQSQLLGRLLEVADGKVEVAQDELAVIFTPTYGAQAPVVVEWSALDEHEAA